MVNRVSIIVGKSDLWSAISASALSIIYIIGQLAEWLGWLGSKGGPESSSTVVGIIVLLTPSLFLGIAFLLLIVTVHSYADIDRKIWGTSALVFATIYTTLISINYFIQLTLVAPHMIDGDVESVRFLLFVPFDSFLYSVDILGYSFMSLSTLFAAFVFERVGLEGTIRRFLIANGVILPFIALQNYYHPLIWFASLWAVTFPGATISLAVLFSRSVKNTGKSNARPVS